MIYAKLAKVQKRLIAPKGQRNDFGKYNYRSCEDILQAVKPLLDEEGCCIFISNDMEQIGDRNYVKAVVTFVDLESGEQIVSTAHAREEETKKGMDGSQITGASSSYARKYALAGLFCIDNEKDSDATNKGDQTQEKKLEVGEVPWESLLDILTGNNINIDKLCGLYKVSTLSQLTARQKEDILKHMDKVRESCGI